MKSFRMMRARELARAVCAMFAICFAHAACSEEDPATPATPNGGAAIPEGNCVIDQAAVPKFVRELGCTADFTALASDPLDVSIPGARSTKIVLDTQDGDALYFQNTNIYKIHYDFALANLSGNGKPIVNSLALFNETEYFVPERRFLLGAITYYEGPKVWALELAPYDTASAAMVEKLFNAVKAKVFFGSALVFHPTSQALATEAKQLPPTIRTESTEALYAGIDYQPLNLGESVGRLRFLKATALESAYVGFRDLVVLDRVPNDISVVAGLITEEFQTPLAHVNVLAQNRKTPNMGLKNASMHAKLKPLEGKWVKLKVGAFDWKVQEVTQAEADTYWDARKPAEVTLPTIDLSVTDLRDIGDVTQQVSGQKVTRAAIATAVKAFGAKAANYSVLVRTRGVPIKRAFAIPAFYYVQFMRENGFDERVRGLLADPTFKGDPDTRDRQLDKLCDDMKAAPVNAEFAAKLKAKLDKDYPGESMRFRTSTNAEDLDGFPCAGC